MTRARAIDGRLQRDDLERLQEELRDVRRQREVLPRENAELAAQLARLEEEVRALQQARAVAHAEWSKTPPSLPAQLVTPFCVTPSRRTPYGRMGFALRSPRVFFSIMMGLGFYFAFFLHDSRLRGGLLVGTVIPWLMMRYLFSQKHEDDDERLAWSFDDEGFGPTASEDKRGKVLYSEVREVEVKQGWLQRRFGFGSVRVTWTPRAHLTLGELVGIQSPDHRRVDLDLLDDPKRLAEWIQARAEQARKEKTGGASVG